ncbi:hypothetical protein JOB18_012727 [Solea senegalensis]|uniref:Uncharacterized protein n=1 Tax=Solea senegalensis TaxID=28829 RepID=A0AAV6QN58_SOLSE|nr:hypothetical protein JOB18_012727 [Solea senegalensis]
MDVVTQWNSDVEMVEHFLKHDQRSWTEVALAVAEDVVKALEPLKAATVVKSPTVSVNAPLHAQLLEKMKKMSNIF